MNIEKFMARLTPQSSGPNPKEPGGGEPEFSAAEISLIASHAPPMCFHALMTKCDHDPISAEKIYSWAYRTSIEEWFTNPVHAKTPVVIGQLDRLIDLSLLSWVLPNCEEGSSVEDRARYVGAARETYRRKYDWHFGFLTGELDYLYRVGATAIRQFLQ